MAPEHEARPRAGLYDHESEEPRRRRRPAADWGVGEDIFDRMPSRFSRAERRAEHHGEPSARRGDDAPEERFARTREADVRGEGVRRADRVVRAAAWDDDDADFGGHTVPAEKSRVVDS